MAVWVRALRHGAGPVTLLAYFAALAAGATVTVVLHSPSTVTLPAIGWRSASRLTYTVTPRP